jgi:hypothetical protein
MTYREIRAVQEHAEFLRKFQKRLDIAVRDMGYLSTCIAVLEGMPREMAEALRRPLKKIIVDVVVDAFGDASCEELIRAVELKPCPYAAAAVIDRVTRYYRVTAWAPDVRLPKIKTLSELSPVNVDIQTLVASMLHDLKTTPYIEPQVK